MTPMPPQPRDFRDDATTCQRPILIFGAPRSGTSLLSRLLNAHPNISIPFESHLFNQWQSRSALYGDLSSSDAQLRLIEDIIRFGVVHDWNPLPRPREVLAHVEGNSFGAIARAFLSNAAAAQGKPRWGEKTPHHTLLHRDVLEAWSDAMVICIERDPRDVALSWKRARFGGDHVLPFAKAWVRYSQACSEVKENFSSDRVFELKYETLVRRPEETLCTLMTFLGEAYDPSQLHFHEASSPWKTDSRNREKLRTPISPLSVGRWEQGLHAREVRLIEAIAGSIMQQKGYALSTPGDGASSGAMAFARWIVAPAKRISGAARNARGFVYLGRDIAWRLRAVGGRKVLRA